MTENTPPNTDQPSLDDLIIEAATTGAVDTLKALLEREKVDTQDFAYAHALASAQVMAAQNNHVDIFKFLLDKGADLFELTLLTAAEYGSTEVASYLLDQGVDINKKDYSGNTPLMWAVRKGHPDIIEILLDRGASLDDREVMLGDTAYMLAAKDSSWGTMEVLATKGADINKSNSDGETPLIWAAKGGNTGTVRELLEDGADLDRTDNKGNTALAAAEEKGHTNVVDLLQEAVLRRAEEVARREKAEALENEARAHAAVMLKQQGLKKLAVASKVKFKP
jgi:ankyrin repeat protein